ncbi:MAG: SDR family NAD(P)-dependent oxidoreductase [Lautropia sp.]
MNELIVEGLFAGEIAVVTGGGQGIGFSVAYSLAAAGCKVVIADQDEARARRAAARIAEAGHRCEGRPLDVSKFEDCRMLAAEVERSLGPVSVLVNNAGVSTAAKLQEDGFDSEVDRILAVNFRGVLNASRAFLPQLERTRGAIVNTSSITAFVAGNSALPYAASKAAVTQATRNMARELGVKGIRVNAIAPGLTRTPLAERAFDDEARVARMTERTALKRLAEPVDMAGPVLFLASRMAQYVTGVTLPVDGGHLAS